ncbi:MAG: 2-oxo acid dehydrogenase subunit E2 [Deltaproteobacteria bacterium]|nr:2-oxo acid dehydrogenase subunit E2 [Deltaproteobacteria bacterium]MBW1923619.1 2-oxo acid dehydrogenase subunit E2 [Deltaproteobacteria bacterium]MBW1948710.1 2-oxo acid dehydrogenase subunit E2 [Deltaproteobacteria bacterium]MBW2006879.1 2-oxo acid dehydrogenase subunit E2 [Deltaproteobacteria bacterium]MBW2101134.1 2-oxo acid dehydrogenase subunit E2 [Deltaproteobacteria bacterium]
MAIEIQVPKLGLTMEEATLVEWKFGPGERVRAEQIVLVLETDKVTYEMPSPGEGLLHPVVAAGSTIKVAQVVGYLAADEEELRALAARFPPAEGEAQTPGLPEASRPEREAEQASRHQQKRVLASPLARAMARDHGLDLARIQGSGPGGRIIKADILKALESKPAPESAQPRTTAAGAGALLSVSEEIPITGIRKVIFRNMHLSLSSQAQLTLHTEANAAAFLDLRARMNKTGAPKVSFNAIMVKIVAQALKQHPRINASVEGDAIKVWGQIHIGVAVDLGRGLIVPKVRYADTKSVREISAELEKLITAAQSNTLGLDDLTMGTFTITNLGAWDIDHFTPIVNHPESAILGVGRIVHKPAVEREAVVVQPRMALSLSFDHRIIDGAPGAAFLKTIKDLVEDPLLML